jgi:hypothetical protein
MNKTYLVSGVAAAANAAAYSFNSGDELVHGAGAGR